MVRQEIYPDKAFLFNSINHNLYHYAGIGACMGFLSSSATEIGERMANGQSFGDVETLIKENQGDYYSVLKCSDKNADSTGFIDFMLPLLLKTIDEIIANEEKVTVKVTQKVTVNQEKILEAIKENPFITQEELSQIIGLSRKSIIQNMKKLQENGLLKRVGADKNGHWEIER